MSKQRPFCLSIAGFDPSGGAGILADIKTFEKLKVTGMSILTCNSIQTENKFDSVEWISPEVIEKQLLYLVSQYKFDSIKIGLIENGEVLLRVLKIIEEKIPKALIIWDPVLKASAPNNLENERFKSNLNSILEKIDYITPNSIELEILFGNQDVNTISSEFKIGVILKGGHSENLGSDQFIKNSKAFTIKPSQISKSGKHGSGCIFSSAFTAYLALGFKPLKACIRAKDFTLKRLLSNKTLLSYYS